MSRHHATPRRGLRGTAAALAVASALPGTAAPANGPDAGLLSAFRDFQAVMVELHALNTEVVPVGDRAAAEAIDRKLTPACARQIQLIEEVTSMPAVTASGLRAKAAMVAAIIPGDSDAFELGPDTYQIQLVMSLANDVMQVAT